VTSELTQRRKKARKHVVAQILLACWCLYVVNVWAFHTSVRSDWSSDGALTVTEQDKELVRSLPGSVEVVVPLNFGPSIEDQLRTRVLLKAIRWLEELSAIAPNRLQRPLTIAVNREGDKWEIERQEYSPVLEVGDVDQIHFFHDGRRLSLSAEELADFKFPNVLEPESTAEILVDRSREVVEAALRQVVKKDWTRVLVSQGRGEPPLDSRQRNSLRLLKKDLEIRGSIVDPIRLSIEESVPKECDLLIIVAGGEGAFVPFRSSVERGIERQLEAGGGVVILLPPVGVCGLEGLMARHGISVEAGLIAENFPVKQGVVRPQFLGVGRHLDPSHPITAPLNQENFTAGFSTARSLLVEKETTGLLYTGPGAWLERDLGAPRRDLDEIPSPKVLAAATEVGEGKLVVISSYSAVLPDFWKGDVRRFLLACFDWASGEDILPPGSGREPISHQIELTAAFRNSFFWTSFLVLPLSALAGGLLVAGLRRRGA